MKATASRVGLNCAALALAMLGMICPAQTAKSAATAANDTYKMKQVQVIDRAALGQPTPAADLLNSRARSLEQQSSRAGKQLQIRAARARLKYEIDEHPVEEWVTAVSVAQASTISTGSGATPGIDCRAVMLYALRAPQGQLDASEKLFRMILSSVRREPDWQRQYLTIVAKLSAAQQAQRQTRAQILRQFQQHEIAVIQGVMANQQRGADQAFVGADQLIRGVEPYRDPATGKTYELSNLYGNAWMNGNNEFVLSEDPNFNPASAFNGDWKPLNHVQPAP
jgi:hypothetical protein